MIVNTHPIIALWFDLVTFRDDANYSIFPIVNIFNDLKHILRFDICRMCNSSVNNQ